MICQVGRAHSLDISARIMGGPRGSGLLSSAAGPLDSEKNGIKGGLVCTQLLYFFNSNCNEKYSSFLLCIKRFTD